MVSRSAKSFSVGDINLDEYREIIPKKIQIEYCYYLNIDELYLIYEQLDRYHFSFESVSVDIESVREFEKLSILSNKAKRVFVRIEGHLFQTGIYVMHEANYQSITEDLEI